MQPTNCLGEGLNVIIDTNYNEVYEWMAFACWYSLSKNLPDATVEINCITNKIDKQLFNWTGRVGAKFYLNKPKNEGFSVPAWTMAIREFKDLTLSEAKEDYFTTFVTYKEGCGNFVMADWINKIECPFPSSDRFMTPLANANEIRILKMWKQMNQTFATVR